MRVLYWSELYWPYIGGAELFGARLLDALQRRGYESIVVASHDYLELPDEEGYQGSTIYRFPFRRVVQGRQMDLLLKTRQQVAALKRAFAPDLVHINGITPNALFHLQTLDAHPAPTLITMNQQVLGSGAAEADTLTGRALHTADWVTCVSKDVLDQVRQWVPELIPRSSVIYTGLEVPAEPPEPLSFKKPRLLCLGRIVPAKGFDSALTALASIRERFPDLRLVVGGDGAARSELEQQAANLGIPHAVDFLGWVAPDRVPALLNSATIVLLPSRHEGLPNVAKQAAMMGRPIVATRVAGLPEVVVDGETGMLIEKEDSQALSESIAFLLDNPDKAIQMGHASRERAMAVFDWQRTVDAYDALQRKLV